MTDLKQAAQQALEALLAAWQHNPHWQTNEAITALRAALEHPEPGSVCARCGGWVCDPVIPQPEQERVIRGLHSITNEDRGVLTLCFADESSAEAFMVSHTGDADEALIQRAALERPKSRWCSECNEHVTDRCHGDERACVFNWSAIRAAHVGRRSAAQPEQEPSDGAIRAAWLAGYTEGEKAALEQPSPDPVDEYRKGFIDGQIDMRDRPEEQPEDGPVVSQFDAIEQAQAHAEAFSRGHDAGWQSAIAHCAALEQPERPNLLGWSFHRNSDGSIGIKSPPPKPGESKRTGESVYPTDEGGLHELLSKFVDHINALEQCSCGDRPKGKCPGEWEPGCDLGNNPAFARRVPLEQPEQEPKCKGIPRHGCNYLAPCDTVCNKCGEIHRHHQMVAQFQAAQQPEQTNPWRDAVDDELVSLHMVASDDPRESIRRLIDWHCAVQIDPLVSSAAQALIERGRREMLAKYSGDTKVLKAAVFVVTRALDELVGACLGEDGRPKVPDRGALMRARAMLPPACEHAFQKGPKEKSRG